jgi:DNA-binding transcriptional LysR family regulator
MIDRRLQLVRMVHEHGSIAAASRLLHVTPPAVSQQIAQLSRELGAPLLRPQGRGVALTEAGLALVRHADVLQAAWEEAEAEIAALGQDTSAVGRLGMCGSATAVSGLLAPAAALLRTQEPKLQVQVREAEAADTVRALVAREADIGVVGATLDTPPMTDRRFEYHVLLDDPFDLLVPADHRFASMRRVSLGDAATEPWIVADPGPSQVDQLIMVACSAVGFTPHVAHRAQEWNAVAAMVAHGLGVSLLPRLAAISSTLAVARVPLAGSPPPRRRLLMCIRQGSRAHPAIATGLEALQVVARDAERELERLPR